LKDGEEQHCVNKSIGCRNKHSIKNMGLPLHHAPWDKDKDNHNGSGTALKGKGKVLTIRIGGEETKEINWPLLVPDSLHEMTMPWIP